jgi:hypothetical protein
MKWFTAHCLYRAIFQRHQIERTRLLEHRYFLLKAVDLLSAKRSAMRLAKKEQHSYLNADGIRVKWILDQLIEVQEILGTRLTEGTEVFHKYCGRRLAKRSKH